jgi:Tol biopolymer transport system component
MPDRWRQIEDLYHRAIELDHSERDAFLAEACAGDEQLRSEVESLLVYQKQAEPLLEKPALELAARSVASKNRRTLEGQRIGSYEILSRLGAGGMGEVYRARDRKLDRDVAIKVLPDAFVHDPERLARLQREAKVLASLNHPNVGVIYDIQEDRGTRFLVLELVEGETLAARLKRGPLPINEALALMKQVAEALSAAHEKGIFHRDLKPANIQITPDGRGKVLDFGLAKIAEQKAPVGLQDSPTVRPATAHGVILGTAAYMSPEQASARGVDKRTDIWAFGCVLYEALTGRPPFDGATVTEIIASVMKSEPNYALLPAETPAPLRLLLRQCLQKDPNARLHDIADARIAIEDFLTEPIAIPIAAAPTVTMLWRWMVFYFASFLIAGAVLGWLVMRSRVEVRPVTHLQIGVQPADQLNRGLATPRPIRTELALSPDGRVIVFSAMRGSGPPQLYSRDLSQSEAVPIEGTEGGSSPFFSPDGQWIGFYAQGQVKKIALAGGPPAVVCNVSTDSAGPGLPAGSPELGLRGASWAEDGTIYFAISDGEISKVPSSGGTPIAITKTGRGQEYRLPQVLPGRKAVIFTAISNRDWEKAQIVLQSFENGEQRVLIEGGVDARYAKTGHLLYMKTGTLMAAAFDAGKLQVVGEPVALIPNVMQALYALNTRDESGEGQFAISDSGTLIYVTGGLQPAIENSLVWVDRKGTAQPLPSIPLRPYGGPRLSPDGTRIAVDIPSAGLASNDIWIYDITRSSLTRITFGGNVMIPVWSPNGEWLAYRSGDSVYRVSADGSGKIERLSTNQSGQVPSSWTAHGNLIALLQRNPDNNYHGIWVLPVDGDRKPKLFLESQFNLAYPEFSPDGRWMAYTSTESGKSEVYVQPYPGPGRKTLISTGGGFQPIWTAGGREVVYTSSVFNQKPPSPPKFFSVRITSLNPFHAEVPQLLFDSAGSRYNSAIPVKGWDSSPDGQRFLLSRREEPRDKPVTQIQVVLNWTEELKRRAPMK